MAQPHRDPFSPRARIGLVLRSVALLVFVIGVLGAMGSRQEREKKPEGKGWLDGLRTDKTWRDSYRGMTPIEASALVESVAELPDPKSHPRMGRGVVVRGPVQSLDLSSPDDPVLVLAAGSNTVRCGFAAYRTEELADLERGRQVVVGGALTDVVMGTPILIACHFEDEWTRR